ncbi:MAG: c-type cytochrome [Burkholderiaceae bacterium]|nr:c-type cytochrome [Burkholderiaceae bacterium]
MTDKPYPAPEVEPSGSLQNAPPASKVGLWAVIAFFVIGGLGYLLGGPLAFWNHTDNAEQDAGMVDARLAPVGLVTLKAVAANHPPMTGEEVFKAQCHTCHETGLNGSPKFQDKAAWAPRVAKGFDTLLQHALNGFNLMPARGGGDFKDVEMARAVVYMANAVGANFPEPAAPADAAAPDAAAAPAASTPAASTPAPADGK